MKGITLAAQENEIVGIVGRSGSGKSTLLKLFMRFWDARQGSVKLAGEEIRTVNTASLRRAESFVTQDTHLFHDSIEANLKLAAPNATREQVVEACKRRLCTSLSAPCPRVRHAGGGAGRDPFGWGERQRLGLAGPFARRALYFAGRTHQQPGQLERGADPALAAARARPADRAAGVAQGVDHAHCGPGIPGGTRKDELMKMGAKREGKAGGMPDDRPVLPGKPCCKKGGAVRRMPRPGRICLPAGGPVPHMETKTFLL